MTVTVLVGGQFGSEGKGKIAGYLANEFQMAIRTGGPNAGHTVEWNGVFYKLQTLPCPVINENCILGIGAGGLIDLSILQREIKELRIQPKRLFIDPQAGIIDHHHVEQEISLKKEIGSTGKGVGAALVAKICRSGGIRLARDVPELQIYLGDIAKISNEIATSGGNLLLEGTQGFGLSLHHGIYPFVTSRDTTAGTLCSDAGISPYLVDEIIMVIRTYPIRVAGNSGPMFDEISWLTVTDESGSPELITENTTVTKKTRRVGRFDINMVKRATLINHPTQIALNFVDYIDHSNKGVSNYSELTYDTKKFIEMVEIETNTPITLIGTGPNYFNIIDLRKEKLLTNY